MLIVPSLALAAVAAAAAAAPAPAASGVAVPAASRTAAAPDSALHIAEDDHVRVEELRVRGESRRIIVTPKAPGAREYEIVPSSGARDPSKVGQPSGGERVWRVFSF